MAMVSTQLYDREEWLTSAMCDVLLVHRTSTQQAMQRWQKEATQTVVTISGAWLKRHAAYVASEKSGSLYGGACVVNVITAHPWSPMHHNSNTGNSPTPASGVIQLTGDTPLDNRKEIQLVGPPNACSINTRLELLHHGGSTVELYTCVELTHLL